MSPELGTAELAGKRVLVVGLARSGMAAAEVLAGVGADVVGFDRDEALEAGRLVELGVEVHLGQEEATLLQGIDLVVKSPGVPGQTPLVEGARERDIPVWSEIELGSRLLDNPILGVTGTNGKTTTSELLGAMFRAADTSVEVAGNVGRPLTSLVGHVTPDAWIVCELSSFQLEDVHTLEPRVGVLLNLEPDHLDRHGTFEAYADAKLRMFEHQSADDTAIVPRGFGAIPGSATRVEFAADDELPAEPRIPGPHNRENAVAATVAARSAGIDDEAIAQALRTFEGVAHRIELVRELRGVRYVNDSKATNVAAARRALASFPGSRLHVILGGRGKHESYEPLAEAFGPGDIAYLIGEAADEIARSLVAAGVPCIGSGTLDRGTRRGREGRSSRRRRPALAGVRELRPVPRLRGARRCLPRARGGARVKGDGHGDQRLVAFVTLGLVAFGLVMVYSATSASAAIGNGDPMSFLKRQAVYALIGIALMTIASRFDYHRLRYLAPPLLLAAFVLCTAVLVLGPAINGARRWFLVGPASFQPSELAKLALCLFAAAYLARRRAPRTFGELFKPLGLLTVVFCGLIVVEPDLGTTITICGMMLAILLVAGVPDPAARDRVDSRAGNGAARDLHRAVSARARVQLPRPVVGRAGRRLPDRAGDHRHRLGRRHRRRTGRGRREDLVPPGGAHGHDLRRHRRGARPHRRHARDLRVRGPRARGVPDRDALPGSVREAPRGRHHGARLRAGRDQPRRRARHRSTHRNPAAVRLLRRVEPRGPPRRDGHSP